MPELPEVETVAKGLTRMFGSQRIMKVTCNRKNLRYDLEQKTLQKICYQQKIKQILRRGKYMVWKLENGSCVIVHLGMSGCFCKADANAPLHKHDHVQFTLENTTEIRYRDPRRFGFIIPIADGNWQQHKLMCHLGIEPLEKNDARELWQTSQKCSTAIKKFIMDQKHIVGVGNIYANESLFLSRIHPSTPSCNVSLPNWELLLKNIKLVLSKAIKKGGTTLSKGGFSDAEGNHGSFALDLHVYKRNGQNCTTCNTLIEQSTLSGRSTYFCPRCQVLGKIK